MLEYTLLFVAAFAAAALGAAIFLSLGLPPVVYIASEATTALAIHGLKTIVYQQYISLDRDFWLLAALLGVAMVLGTWSAKRVIEGMPREKFQRFVAVLLVVTRAAIGVTRYGWSRSRQQGQFRPNLPPTYD